MRAPSLDERAPIQKANGPPFDDPLSGFPTASNGDGYHEPLALG